VVHWIDSFYAARLDGMSLKFQDFAGKKTRLRKRVVAGKIGVVAAEKLINNYSYTYHHCNFEPGGWDNTPRDWLVFPTSRKL